MKKEEKFPDINGLIGDLVSPEINSRPIQVKKKEPDKGEAVNEFSKEAPVESTNLNTKVSDWDTFRQHLDSYDVRGGKDERMVCRLDRDLSDTLDDINIDNKSRSDLVNAIVRTFFDFHLEKFTAYRREKFSLLSNLSFKREAYVTD